MSGFPVTAAELREASQESKERYEGRSDEKKMRDWLRWFEQEGPSLVREAVRKGLYQISVDLPFSPRLVGAKVDTRSFLYKGKFLTEYVKEMIVGCKTEYVEMEVDREGVVYMLDVSWKV